MKDTAGNEIFEPLLRCPANCGLTCGCKWCVPLNTTVSKFYVPKDGEVDQETEEQFYKEVFKTKLL